MHVPRVLLWLPLLLFPLLLGCGSKAAKEEARIEQNLARLSDEDRKLAEEQRFCPLMEDTRLGAMGTPVKVVLNGQTVFLCCDSCRKHAEEHQDETLKAFKDMKDKMAREKIAD